MKNQLTLIIKDYLALGGERTLKIERGNLCIITGANTSGKSSVLTAMRCLLTRDDNPLKFSDKKGYWHNGRTPTLILRDADDNEIVWNGGKDFTEKGDTAQFTTPAICFGDAAAHEFIYGNPRKRAEFISKHIADGNITKKEWRTALTTATEDARINPNYYNAHKKENPTAEVEEYTALAINDASQACNQATEMCRASKQSFMKYADLPGMFNIDKRNEYLAKYNIDDDTASLEKQAQKLQAELTKLRGMPYVNQHMFDGAKQAETALTAARKEIKELKKVEDAIKVENENHQTHYSQITAVAGGLTEERNNFERINRHEMALFSMATTYDTARKAYDKKVKDTNSKYAQSCPECTALLMLDNEAKIISMGVDPSTFFEKDSREHTIALKHAFSEIAAKQDYLELNSGTANDPVGFAKKIKAWHDEHVKITIENQRKINNDIKAAEVDAKALKERYNTDYIAPLRAQEAIVNQSIGELSAIPKNGKIEPATYQQELKNKAEALLLLEDKIKNIVQIENAVRFLYKHDFYDGLKRALAPEGLRAEKSKKNIQDINQAFEQLGNDDLARFRISEVDFSLELADKSLPIYLGSYSERWMALFAIQFAAAVAASGIAITIDEAAVLDNRRLVSFLDLMKERAKQMDIAVLIAITSDEPLKVYTANLHLSEAGAK